MEKRASFKCPECKKEHVYSIYALAQLSQGHELTFTCDCGQKLYLKRRTVKRAS